MNILKRNHVEEENNYIDIHSHIVPAIDDGAPDINKSIEMLKNAKKAGIKKIVLTPHFMTGTYVATKKEVEELVYRIRKVIEAFHLDIEVLQGNEIMLDLDTLQNLKDGVISTISGTRYVLIELDMKVKTVGLENIIKKFVDSGYTPIIAHPERYSYVKKDYKIVKSWIDAGALTQMNISSILGMYGEDAKKTVIKLLKHKLIYLWGSDVHSFRNSYETLPESMALLKKVLKKDFNKIVFENPRKILNNELL